MQSQRDALVEGLKADLPKQVQISDPIVSWLEGIFDPIWSLPGTISIPCFTVSSTEGPQQYVLQP